MTKELLQVYSYIRGYHAYLSIWEPKVDEMYALKRKPQNKEDSNAVAIVRPKLLKSIVMLLRELQDLNVEKPLRNHILALMK